MNSLSVPVQFEIGDQLEDDRFLKVKVFIAHTGENLNNSKFSKEVLEEMAGTLAGIPIVGYIKDKADGGKDFDNHRQKIVIKDGDVDVVYSGHAYGFIPTENVNTQFEIRGGKEWLTVEGIIWTKFRDSISIILDGNGVKSQSMEVEVFDSFVDDEGLVNYTKARFSGLCILGDDVPPGMAGSTIELFSHRKEILVEFRQMIAEFSKTEEDGKVPTQEELDAVATNTTEVDEATVETQEFADKEKGKKEKGSKKQDESTNDEEVAETEEDENEKTSDKKDQEETDDESDEEKAKKDGKKSKKANFAISHEETRNQLRDLVKATIQTEDSYVYVCQVFDDYVISQVETYNEDGYKVKHLLHTYTKEGDTIVLGSEKDVVPTFLTKEEMAQVEATRTEIKDIKEKLSLYENSAKEEKVVEFEEVLGEEKANEIRANFEKMTIEEVEKEVGFACFQINQKNKEEESTTVTAVNFSGSTESDKASKLYGGLGAYFN